MTNNIAGNKKIPIFKLIRLAKFSSQLFNKNQLIGIEIRIAIPTNLIKSRVSKSHKFWTEAPKTFLTLTSLARRLVIKEAKPNKPKQATIIANPANKPKIDPN